jgi:acyl carrier protein
LKWKAPRFHPIKVRARLFGAKGTAVNVETGRKELTASTFEQVRSIASDVFGLPTNKITAESSPETIESWDSMQHLNLVLAIEEKFGVQLAPEEIEQMKTVGAVAALVEKRLESTSR